MAAKTPATVKHLSSGNGVSVILASFSDIDDGDTWTSGMNGIVSFVVVPTNSADNATATAAVSSGTFTFQTGASNLTVDLLIYKR